MPQTPLPALIDAALRKEQKAQSRLINLFWQSVYDFISAKGLSHDEADELTVMVFSKVLNKLELYDPAFQFKTWLLTIAQNTLIDFWRKQNREQFSSLESTNVLDKNPEKSPEEVVISHENLQHIQKILADMDPKYRMIISLRFFEEKSIKEIAEELNLSVPNTKVRIMRAKRMLAELLRQSGEMDL